MYLYFFRFFPVEGQRYEKGWKPLYFFVLPGCFFQIKGAGYQQAGVINHFGGEANANGHPQPHPHYIDVEDVKYQGRYLDQKGRTGVSGSGDAAESHVAYRADQHGPGNDVDGGHGGVDQRGVVGVDREDGPGKENDKSHADGHNVKGHAGNLDDGGDDLGNMAGADRVADERIGGGGQGANGDQEDDVDAAHDVGDGQIALA